MNTDLFYLVARMLKKLCINLMENSSWVLGRRNLPSRLAIAIVLNAAPIALLLSLLKRADLVEKIMMLQRGAMRLAGVQRASV